MSNQTECITNSKNAPVARKRKRQTKLELRKQQIAVRKFIQYFYKTSFTITNSDFSEIAKLVTQSDKRHFARLLFNEFSNHKKVLARRSSRIPKIPNMRIFNESNSITTHCAAHAFCRDVDQFITEL